MKNINRDAKVQCRKQIDIHASRDIVWALLSNIDRWPEWQPDISQSKLESPLAAGARFTWKSGGARINSALHTVEAPHLFGWIGKTFGISAIHNWSLEEKNGYTQVIVEESMDGILATLFRGSFNRDLEKGIQNWLNHLKQEAEKLGAGIKTDMP